MRSISENEVSPGGGAEEPEVAGALANPEPAPDAGPSSRTGIAFRIGG